MQSATIGLHAIVKARELRVSSGLEFAQPSEFADYPGLPNEAVVSEAKLLTDPTLSALADPESGRSNCRCDRFSLPSQGTGKAPRS